MENSKSAWEDIEKTAKETVGIDYNQPFELEQVLKEKLTLAEDKFKLFIKLKELKNKAVRAPPTGVSSGTATGARGEVSGRQSGLTGTLTQKKLKNGLDRTARLL